MNRTRHQHANALFLAALELEPAAIPDFVKVRCGDDDALAQQVYALLAADAHEDGFLESAALVAEPTGPDSIVGERGYRLLQRIGAGGMGEVWLAERSDGEFRQRVAIKLMQHGQRMSRDARRRFRAERQILASLNHPNIARLLDGGTLANGAPFLVMEHVDGDAIDAWCARQTLDVHARVRLFLKVCDAVQLAHQALVVHRDLKPSNILVGSDGEPKLLDFGIAKVLNADAFAHSLAQTRTGAAPMTLAYASPEQVRGETVGTTSDVYSLGVVLYELLTGVLPHRRTQWLSRPSAPAITSIYAPFPGVLRMKILMVLTSHDRLGDTGKKTGFWLEEFAAPYYVFKDAGADMTLASPKGGQPPLDPKSDEPDAQTDATRRFRADADATAALASTRVLAEVAEDDFDAVFYPGGHGPLWDLAKDGDSIGVIESNIAAGKPVALVCHAPGALKMTHGTDGEPLVKGKRVTGFTNSEEAAVGLTQVVPFLVEDMLKANGGHYEKKGDWAVHVVTDGNLVTGQNPASSEAAAEELLRMLAKSAKP